MAKIGKKSGSKVGARDAVGSFNFGANKKAAKRRNRGPRTSKSGVVYSGG